MDCKQHDSTTRLSKFRIPSGPRKLDGGLCDPDPKYRMPAPPPLEIFERVGLDNVEYIY